MQEGHHQTVLVAEVALLQSHQAAAAAVLRRLIGQEVVEVEVLREHLPPVPEGEGEEAKARNDLVEEAAEALQEHLRQVEVEVIQGPLEEVEELLLESMVPAQAEGPAQEVERQGHVRGEAVVARLGCLQLELWGEVAVVVILGFLHEEAEVEVQDCDWAARAVPKLCDRL